MRLIPKNFSVNLPWGMGGVSIDLSENAERAAWALYVELNTRIATEPLKKGEGSVREALTSLHHLFGIIRDELKKAGIDVARSRKGKESLASISFRFLNDVIRPDLVRWHTSLSAYEADTWNEMLDDGKTIPNHPALAGALVNESDWKDYELFYSELELLQAKLIKYVRILGALAGVEMTDDVQLNNEDD